jgi:hypothetical protein
MDVHFGDLERVGQPIVRHVRAALGGDRVPHQVVPPLAARPVEAVRERGDGVLAVTGAGVRGKGDHHPQSRETGVALHDRAAPRELQ